MNYWKAMYVATTQVKNWNISSTQNIAVQSKPPLPAPEMTTILSVMQGVL